MNKLPPFSAPWFTHLLQPWFPAFEIVTRAAQRDHMAAIPILGLPRKTERANEYHRVIRNHLKQVELESAGLLSLVEEGEGDGLDYMVCNMAPSYPFGIRWSRMNGSIVRRNTTGRSRIYQSQGYLWDEMAGDEMEKNPLPMVTLAYLLADDYVLNGMPKWWVHRLVLLRETTGKSQEIAEVATFEQPPMPVPEIEDLRPLIKARNRDQKELSQVIQRIRSQAG